MEHPPSTRSVRVLVQRTTSGDGWTYRLIAYEDKQAYVPLQFDAVSDLVNVIRRVIPEFSEDSLAPIHEAVRSHIAFSADCELDDSQLLLLGLARSGKVH